MITFRLCPKCQTETERNANGRCKVCQKAYGAARYASNRKIISAQSAKYYAANSEKIRASNAVRYAASPEKTKARYKEWNAANPGKGKARVKAWYAANTEKAKAAIAAWQAANPESLRIHSQNRRALKQANGGKLSQGLSAKLFKLQKGKCPCCNLPLGDDYHLDHIMPLALGGTNTDDNVQLLHPRCNFQKHAAHPVDFMQSRGFLL